MDGAAVVAYVAWLIVSGGDSDGDFGAAVITVVHSAVVFRNLAVQ